MDTHNVLKSRAFDEFYQGGRHQSSNNQILDQDCRKAFELSDHTRFDVSINSSNLNNVVSVLVKPTVTATAIKFISLWLQ